MSDEYGPPTLEDDAWFTQYVASLDYPKVKRDPKPMQGQRTLMDALEDERMVARALEREARDEQRAREDEAEQFRTHRPE